MPIYGLWLAVWTYSLLDLSFADMFLKHAFNPLYDLRRNSYGVLEFDGNKPELEREFDCYLRTSGRREHYWQ